MHRVRNRHRAIRGQARLLVIVLLSIVSLAACGEADAPADSTGQDVSPSVIASDVPTRMTTAEPANTPLRASTATPVATDVPTTQPAAETPSALPDVSTQIPPTIAAEPTYDPSCSGTIGVSIMAFETLDILAWSSQQIVVGTVVAVSEPIMQNRDGGIMPVSIFRIATVAVESQVRGQPVNEVHVLVAGGAVGACTQQHPGSPDLIVGERVLAFLQELAVDVDSVDGPIHGFVGEGQGQWMLGADDALIGPGPERYITNLRQPLANTIQQIVGVLRDGPDERTAGFSEFVSLDDAPLVEMP